jgi:hypothetical protein
MAIASLDAHIMHMAPTVKSFAKTLEVYRNIFTPLYYFIHPHPSVMWVCGSSSFGRPSIPAAIPDLPGLHLGL